MGNQTKQRRRTIPALSLDEINGLEQRGIENADVVEGARAIGLTLGAPTVSQFGIVEGLLVDRAFVDDRHLRDPRAHDGGREARTHDLYLR